MSEEKEGPHGFWQSVGREARDAVSIRAYPRAVYRALNLDAIKTEAANIRRLWGALREPRGQGVTLVTLADGTIDLTLTAEVAGISIGQVEMLLALRLRRTTFEFWCYSLVGVGWLAMWMMSALFVAPAMAGWWSGALTVLLVVTVAAKAMEAALANWQVRVLKLAGLREFLSAADTILPSRRGAVRPR